MKFKTYYLILFLLTNAQFQAFAQDSTYVEPEESQEVEIYEEDESEDVYEAVVEAVKNDQSKVDKITLEESDKLAIKENKTYDLKTIPKEEIDKYLRDSDFKYVKPNSEQTRERNWIGDFFRALSNLIEKIFGFKISPVAFQIIKGLIILSIVGIGAFLLAKYLGISFDFRRKKKKQELEISFEELEENLEDVNFKNLIEKAIKSKSYRVAIRLYFLKNLQSLAKHDLIEWEIDKTNVDYKYELEGKKIKDKFDEIVYLYEHIWYGDFELSDEEYQKAINVFQKFDKKMSI